MTHPPAQKRADRWRPTRAGILNVWRYYDEVFTFHRGRLLLRGRNGTGKSKALELLLPFLLDASLRPNRLSTFGGSERVMHWNMIGHGYPGATRVGYVWLEFARPGTSGTEYLTLGARLQATRDTSSVKAAYFTATARVGEDLDLLTPEQQPLTVKQLRQVLQPDEGTSAGVVHSGPEEYRSAIRALLYPGLDQARYDALITALLQLRTPKLSERLDPGLLSSLLSSALPPLGRGELADIADGFERLDRHREELRALADEVREARKLADRQRVYAARVLRGAAARLISATTEMDTRAQELGEVERRAEDTRERIQRLADRSGELEALERGVSAHAQGLKDSEAYRAGAGIEHLRERAEHAGAEARAREEESQRRQGEAARLGSEAAALAAETERAERAVSVARAAAERAAERADLAGLFREAEGTLGAGSTAEVGEVRRLLRAAVDSRRSQITEVLSALAEYEGRLRRREELEADLADLSEQLTEAEDEAALALRERDAAVEALAEDLTVWAGGCRELSWDGPDALVEAIDADTGTGPHRLVASARQNAGESLAALAQDARGRAEQVTKTRERVSARIAELESAAEVPPVPPRTRTADRADRPGAPLWRLVAFTEHTPEPVRAGVEAALEASGLLDAWVFPDGSVPAGGVVGDTAAITSQPVPGPSLLEVLKPEPGTAVAAERIRALLAGVAYADGPVSAPRQDPGREAWIGSDGSWGLGPLRGRWTKDEPAHIGASARERARERALAELRAQLTGLDEELSAARARQDRLAERRRRLDAEVAALPSDRASRTAAEALHLAQNRTAERADGVHRHQVRLAEQLPHLTAAEQGLRTLAARHRLPVGREPLERTGTALDALSRAVDSWLDAQVDLHGLAGRAEQVQESAREALDVASEAAGAASEARTSAQDLRDRLAAVEATVGVEHRHVLEQVSAAQTRLSQIGRDLAAVRSQRLELSGEHGELLGRVRSLGELRSAAVQARDGAAARFRSLAATPLWEDSGLTVTPAPALDDTVRGTLEAARAVAATADRADHSSERISGARAKVADAVHASRDVLAKRTYLELVPDGDVQLVSALLDGGRVGARGLYTALAEEERARATDLTVEERSLFDRVLTGDTRRHLADRLRRATALVEGMNERLARVRTASRIAVRLRWEVAPDAPSGTERARELLVRDPRRLSDAQRETLHAFFRERVDDARDEDSAASWEEHLAQVLDYTAWHRFTVELDKDDGAGWKQLTRRAHGQLSGGEKAIALHLPLFAAVAAHYATDPGAPRFILLDEVFVGVDAANRGQIFALLVDLGLDLVLTSDHEWCTYAELDGIAVHQLIPAGADDDDDAVTTARWVWTGSALEEDEGTAEEGESTVEPDGMVVG